MTESTPEIQPSKSTSAALWILITSLAVYIISWLIPAYSPDVKGYDAYNYTYRLIFEMEFDETRSLWDKIVLILASVSPHTNYFIVIIMIALLAAGSRLPGLPVYRNILIIFLVINLVWMYGFTEDMSRLRIGYYLWIISFILVIIATNIYISKNKK
jgi:hypothetical protein